MLILELFEVGGAVPPNGPKGVDMQIFLSSIYE